MSMPGAPPPIDPNWLSEGISRLFDLVGIGGFALALRAGRRVGSAEADLAAVKGAITKLEAADAARQIETSAMREKIAALPTREEMAGMFREVREDLRDLKGQPRRSND